MFRKYFPLVFILLIFVFGGLWDTRTTLAQDGTSERADEQALESVWERARKSGAYEFRTLINQTTYPAPSIGNAGKQPKVDKVGLDGAINAYAESFNMTLWQNASFDPNKGIEMKVENGRSYVRTGLSEWEEVNNGISDTFAPAGDPLNFLGGISGVQQGEDVDFALGPVEQTFTTYHFTVEGSELATYLRRILQHQLQQTGDLPAGMQLGELEGYEKMTGTGALWVGADNLPARLHLDLDMGVMEAGERITAVITTEFRNFDMTLLETSFLAEPQQWLQAKLPTVAAQQQVSLNITLILVTLLIATILTIHWQKRWVYKVVAVFLTLALIFSPLLNGEVTHAYYERTRAEARQKEADKAEYEAYVKGQEALKSDWNPHQDPRSTHNKVANEFTIHNSQSTIHNSSPALLLTNTDSDSDGDGLSDDVEYFWESCAYPLNSTEYNDSEDCTDVADPSDSDGDGLPDFTEVNQTYTFPDLYDSDGDAITDTLEVQGFSYLGQTWYLDPNERDTNSDGVSDVLECPVWYPLDENFDPTAICPDTDNDGTPDPFDDDNDNDGVLDADDLDINYKGAETYSYDNPFKLSIDGLQMDKPVLVELQFRPTVPEHLQYSGLILDWPSGDYDGQIQRALDTTFATTADADAYSTADNASYGDIKIVPMLEVYIPYSDGHYGNLPVKSSYSGIARTLDLTMSQWLDTTELDPYGIIVTDADEESGDLVAYVPLATKSSHTSDNIVAFSTQMLYYPSQGSNGLVNWGSDHEYRVTWVVQMITDYCVDGVDEDGDGNPNNEDSTTCTREDDLNIIHTYEETWELTGFSVSEEHRFDIALLYEDPNENQGQYPLADSDLEYDDLLWLYGWNLTNIFTTGLDCETVVDDVCEGDGARDVTLENLATNIEAWSTVSGTVENYVEIVNHSYIHSGYLAVVAMTETVEILDTHFITYSDQTKPSIMFVSESVNRLMSLSSLDSVPSGTLTLDFTGEVTQTFANLSLTTYEYDVTAASWQGVDEADYLDYLVSTLEKIDYFQPEDEREESIDEADGKLIWAQTYYTALTNGMSGYVEIEGTPFYSPGGETIAFESDYIWLQTLADIRGGVGVLGGARVAAGLARGFFTALFSGRNVFYGSWKALKDVYTTAEFGFFINKKFRSFTDDYQVQRKQFVKFANVWQAKILTVATILFVIGAAVYIASYFIADEATAEIVSKIGQAIISVSTIILMVLQVTTLMSKLSILSIYRGVGLSTSVAKGFKAATRAKLTSSFAWAAVVAYIVTVVIIWGMYFYQMSQIGWDWDSVTANYLLAATIVSFAFQTVLFLISLLFPVGTIIVMIYGIIEAILTLIGLFWDDVKTISEVIQKAITDTIYVIDLMIANFSDPSRLQFEIDYGLLDPGLGFVKSNSLLFTTTLTNTIVATDVFASQTMNTFAYHLQNKPLDQHVDLALAQIKNDWQREEGIFTTSIYQGTIFYTIFGITVYAQDIYTDETFDGASLARTVAITLPFEFAGTGVNEPISTFYLTEGYAVATRGCWTVIIALDCQWDASNGSSHIPIDYLVFDIIPDTLTEFVSLDWSGREDGDWRFPGQMDKDGDGLLSVVHGGVDPNDNFADTDYDGLRDGTEISYGYDPLDADMDDDGLLDGDEVYIYYSDPELTDTDGDGLNDYLEVVQGWLIPYTDSNGATQLTRVWSSPFYTDYDGDGLSDLQEFSFGFHPNVPTDPSAIANIVEFGQIGVNEADAPLVLLKMDESVGERVFNDASGERHNAICDWTAVSCPTAGNDGVYGNALDFDGSDDTLVISDTQAISLSNRSFTIAAWAKRDSSGMHDYIVWQGTTVNNKGLHFGFRSNNRFTCAFWGDDLTAPDTYTDTDWHHWACTYDAEAGKRILYRDGLPIDDDTATAHYQGGGSLYIGSRLADYFDGMLDEVMVYDRVLSESEIGEVVNGRYNTNDLFVRAGDPLTYQATVTNTSATQGVDGLLVGTSTTVDPNIGSPEAYLSFNANDQRIRFETEIGSDSLTCVDNGTCPTIGITGTRDYAVHFDGIDDFITLPVINRPATDEQVFSFWLDVDTLPTGNDRAYLLDTDSEEAGALDLYLNSNGKLVVDILGTDAYSSSFTLTDNSGWQNVFFWVRAWTFTTQLYDRFNYGGENGHTLIGEDTFTVLIGPGTLGNNVSGDSGFEGAIDDLVFYPESFGNDNATVSYFYHESIYDGDFYLGVNTPNISDHIPSLLVRFNETTTDYDREMINRVTDGGLMTCDEAVTCPAIDSSGVFSQGLQFDGNDVLSATTVLNFAVDDYTIGFWFKSVSTNHQTLLIGRNASDNGDVVLLELLGSGAVRYLHRYPSGSSGGTNLYSAAGYNDGAWHYVTAVKAGSNMTLYIDGNLVGETDSAADQGPAELDISLGQLDHDSRHFTGFLDEMIWLPTAVTTDGVDYLMNSIYPTIDVLDDFVTYNAGAQEAVTVAGTASVHSTAPTSAHLFETEVEAALQLQGGFTYPVIDDNSANLDYFF